jgi:hypothetical protein
MHYFFFPSNNSTKYTSRDDGGGRTQTIADIENQDRTISPRKRELLASRSCDNEYILNNSISTSTEKKPVSVIGSPFPFSPNLSGTRLIPTKLNSPNQLPVSGTTVVNQSAPEKRALNKSERRRNALKTPVYLLLINILMTCVLLPLLVWESYFSRRGVETNLFHQNIAVQISLFSTAAIALLVSWSMYFVLLKKVSKSTTSEQSIILKSYLKSLQMIMLISTTLSFAILLIVRSFSSKCSNNDIENYEFPLHWNCNPYASVPIFPLDSAFELMSIPMLFVFVMKEKRMYLATTSWFISILSLIISAIATASIHSIQIIVVYVIISLISMYDSYQSHVLNQSLYRQLQGSMEERHRLEDQQRMSEMKDMIANVAHDLKTVSTRRVHSPTLLFN